jgi:hypothetical protein
LLVVFPVLPVAVGTRPRVCIIAASRRRGALAVGNLDALHARVLQEEGID